MLASIQFSLAWFGLVASLSFDGNDDKPTACATNSKRNGHKQPEKSKTSTMNYNQKKCMMEKVFHSSLIFIFNLDVVCGGRNLSISSSVSSSDCWCHLWNPKYWCEFSEALKSFQTLHKHKCTNTRNANKDVREGACVFRHGFCSIMVIDLCIGICLNYKHATDIKLMNNDGYMMRCLWW